MIKNCFDLLQMTTYYKRLNTKHRVVLINTRPVTASVRVRCVSVFTGRVLSVCSREVCLLVFQGGVSLTNTDGVLEVDTSQPNGRDRGCVTDVVLHWPPLDVNCDVFMRGCGPASSSPHQQPLYSSLNSYKCSRIYQYTGPTLPPPPPTPCHYILHQAWSKIFKGLIIPFMHRNCAKGFDIWH